MHIQRSTNSQEYIEVLENLAMLNKFNLLVFRNKVNFYIYHGYAMVDVKITKMRDGPLLTKDAETKIQWCCSFIMSNNQYRKIDAVLIHC